MIWLEEFSIIAAIAVALTGVLLILFDNRRLILSVLAVQYIFVAWLVSLSLPPQVTAAKLVAGLFSCTIIAVALVSIGWTDRFMLPRTIPSGIVFRIIAVALVLLVALGIGSNIWSSIPNLSLVASYGATFLFSLGLLQLGFQEEPVKVGIGLLTTLSGFEVVYTTIEPSLAVMALMASVHLGIAVVVSYLLMIGSNEKPRLEG
jgi:hypothetical protein